jgi:polar amino acid transport system substrate-binding protein
MKPLRHFILSAILCAAIMPRAQAQTVMSFVMEPFPPFVGLDKGAPSGPFPDVVRAVCAAIQAQCKFESLPWRRAFVMAEMGNVDGILVLVHTVEREKNFYFTEPVIQSSYALFVRTGTALSYSAPKDLAGYTIAAYGPSGTSAAAEELAKHVAGLRLEIEVDNQAVLRKLDGGRYQQPAAAVMNRDVGLSMIAQQKITGLKVAGEMRRVDYAIGLSRKRVAPELAERFNAALRDLVKKGTVKAIADKYGLKAAN